VRILTTMPILQRITKPKTQRGKRFLEKNESKLIENTKTALFIRGAKTSDVVLNCLKDLNALKKPHAVYFNKKNSILPFEDTSSLEFFSQKNDSSLFMFGSHNKKRPHNLVIGRMYDYHLLDMFELGIEKYKALKEFVGPKIPLGTKPCLIFAGDAFEQLPDYQRLKNLFIDFFRGDEAPAIRLAGLEHVIMFTVVDQKIHFRSYRVQMKKSGSKIPRIELEEIGPSLDLVMRRTKLATSDLFKTALRQPKQLKPNKVKNIKRDAFGSKMGRIHMQKQDLGKLQTRKLKGLKKSPAERKANNQARKRKPTGANTNQARKRKLTGANTVKAKRQRV